MDTHAGVHGRQQQDAGAAPSPRTQDGMDLLGGLSGTPRHRILTGRIRTRTRDRQMSIWPTPRGRESASVKECDGRLGTPDKTPGDLFSSFGSPPPPLCVRARSAESSGCGRGRRACGRAAHTPSRPQTHLRIPRLRRLAARACHAPALASDSRSDFGVAYLKATGRCCEKKYGITLSDTETLPPRLGLWAETTLVHYPANPRGVKTKKAYRPFSRCAFLTGGFYAV